MKKKIPWAIGKKKIYGEIFTPKKKRSGIRTQNSRRELIKQESVVDNTRIWRGMKIFVTRLDLPTMEPIVVVVPFARNLHAIRPTRI
jgi:hypothetical protein